MTKTIENYVFPVCCGTKDGESDGCGVLVGDLFVTAGHVIEHSMVAHVYIDHIDYELHKEDALYYSFDDKDSLDTNASDVAVFRLKGVEPSALTLAEDFPAIGEDLISVSFRRPSKRTKAMFGYASNDDEFELVACNARVAELSCNFFACDMSITLKPGSSGSPVIDESGRVVGILHGDKDNQCVFQSTESIFKFINK